MFVKGVKIYWFEVKDSESNSFPLYLGNISKDFTVNNKETGLDVHVMITIALVLMIYWTFINF